MSSSSSPLVDPIWDSLSDELEQDLIRGVGVFDSSVVQYSMIFEHPAVISREMEWVQRFGMDHLIERPTDVHHAYSVCVYRHYAGMDFHPRRIVEWGGGYGGMCRMWKSVFPDCEYNIIDLSGPLLAQRIYLEDHDLGGVQLWDLQRRDEVPDADFFLSTWALSESPEPAHEYVMSERNFFNAEWCFLAFQETKWLEGFSGAKGFSEKLDGFSIEPCLDIDQNFYAMRRP